VGYRRVLLASEMYWPDVGGAESANHLIAKKLAKSFEEDVISGTNLPTSEVRDFHSYTCWPALRSSLKFETWVRMASSFRSVGGLLEKKQGKGGGEGEQLTVETRRLRCTEMHLRGRIHSRRWM
jgi:hypothetical protein